MYYVYVLFDWLGTPRYVGKGVGSRWLQHERRSERRNPNYAKQEFIERTWIMLEDIPKIKVRERISEEEAFATEVALIKAIGRADQGTGPLTNMSDGGDGEMDPERRRANGKKAWSKSIGALTKEQRVANGHKAWETRRRNGEAYSEEQLDQLRKSIANARSHISRDAVAAAVVKHVGLARAAITEASYEKRLRTIKETYSQEERSDWGRRGGSAAMTKLNQSRTFEERSAAGVKAGKASAAARRRKREAAQISLELPAPYPVGEGET